MSAGRSTRAAPATLSLAAALALGGGTSLVWAAPAAAAGESGVTATVDGVPLQGGSPRVPGCTVTIAVSGIAPGTHDLTVTVDGKEPSGSGTLVDTTTTTSTGSAVVGPDNLVGVVQELGLVAKDNGYHLQVTVAVDGVTAVSQPVWLACGVPQHAGQSVRVTFAVQWKGADGKVSSVPPRGLPKGFALLASSSLGTATCAYPSGSSTLSCSYVTTEEDTTDEGPGTDQGGGPPPGLKVSGLGTFVVSEQGLPAGWAPEPTTVGELASSPWLPGGGSKGPQGDLVPAVGGPPTQVQTVVNVERQLRAGYRTVSADGGVRTFGSSGFFGSMNAAVLAGSVAGIAQTADGAGYWLVASDGGVFSLGDAAFHGSLAGQAHNGTVVGIAPTPDDGGYWLAASDGGVFSFGDASFHGSMGGRPLNEPVVGIAPTPSGLGYWLVASDGGVFAFGDAGYFGSMAGSLLNRPMVGIAATPSGLGYWLVASDGGVFAFGDAPFAGSMGGRALVAPVVGMTSTTDGTGYWLAASDGGIFAFGDAAYVGSSVGRGLESPVVGVAG